jgi:hypothetical protein
MGSQVTPDSVTGRDESSAAHAEDEGRPGCPSTKASAQESLGSVQREGEHHDSYP